MGGYLIPVDVARRWVREEAPEMEYSLRHFTGQAVDALLGKREVAHYFNAYEFDVAFISEGVYTCTNILQRVEGASAEAILLQSAVEYEHHTTARMHMHDARKLKGRLGRKDVIGKQDEAVRSGNQLEYSGRY